MLNYEKKGSYKDPTGFVWEYYQDDVNLSIFYVMPRPDWVLDANGQPEIKLVTYKTDDALNGSGYVTFNTQLSVPNSVDDGVKGQIAIEFPSAPKPYQLNPLDYNAGCTAEFALDIKSTTTNYMATASEFGANVATFRADLPADGMATIVGLLSTAGGGLDVTYNLNVQARLNAVNATLHFDSAIAYKYQVQHAQHHAYAADTPRIVTKLLNESASSTVHLQWGIQNPPKELVDSVTNWANDTIGSLVSAEVKTALSILGEKSYDSFSINEVSSFTSVYNTDQVINWKLYPKGSLPAVANIANHSTVVDARKQVMTISANLPFIGEKVKGANVPTIDAKPVELKQVTVQVTYPGLPQAESTHVFTKNGSVTFVAPYDATQQDKYDVSWTAEYVDSAAQPAVTGQQLGVTEGNYGIELPSVGILDITFEARNAFAPLEASKGSVTPPVVTSIDIDFHFAATDGNGKAIHQKHTILAPPAAKKSGDAVALAQAAAAHSTQTVFTSYVAHNVVTGTAYSYIVTYHFAEGPDFVAPETSSTSYNETIATPPAPHGTNVMIVAKLADSTAGGGKAPTVVDATVNVWFDTEVTIPGAGPQPTQSNPTTFDLRPNTSDPVMFAIDTFYGFLHGHTPLVYTASISTLMGEQINIQPTLIQNGQSTIELNPATRYTTITVEMDAVDWPATKYDKIVVAVNATVKDKDGKNAKVSGSTANFTFVPLADGKAHNAPRYITYTHTPDEHVIDFTWTATYTTSGVGSTTATGSGNSKTPTIMVPPKGTSALIPVKPQLKQVVAYK
ncbi:MAG: hypothetical protein ACSHXB_02765 [Sulfitobacter sp.]